MSIATEITRLQGLKGDIRTKLIALGVTSNPSATLDDCADALDGIVNRAAVDATIDIATPTYTVPAGYHNGSGAVKLVPEVKSATPSASAQDITPSAGKVLSKVTVNAIPSTMADVSGVTAVEADVLATKVFVKANKASVAGTMVNNGAVSGSFNGTTVTQYTVPVGYHNGSGKVQLDGTIEAALAAI